MPAGGARPGAGRPKGAVQRLSVEFRERVEQACADKGFDLVEEIIDIARDHTSEDRMAALKLVVDYAYPKLKAVEMQVTEVPRFELIDASQLAPDDPLG